MYPTYSKNRKEYNDMNEKIPRMETINRAAELTGLSYSVIYNLCKENRIVYIKTGRKYLINMDKLTVFLNRGEEECPGGEK